MGTDVRFTWSEAGADAAGLVPAYEVTTTVNGATRETALVAGSGYTVSGVNPGDEVSVSVRAVNPHDPANKAGSATSTQPIRVLAAEGDEDGDGMRNDAEQVAGTNALDGNSRLTASVVRSGNGATITWSTAPGRSYKVQYRDNLVSGGWIDIATGENSGAFVHDDVGEGPGFYRVVVEE